VKSPAHTGAVYYCSIGTTRKNRNEAKKGQA
jgi:hypothetical protein